MALSSDIITLVTSWHTIRECGDAGAGRPSVLPETGKHSTYSYTMCAAGDVLMNGWVASLYNYFTVRCIIILQGLHLLTLERLVYCKAVCQVALEATHTFGVYHVS